jgi:glycyl-tRNA synthetase beta chain
VAELLLEVGFEEMPAPWLPDLARQLESRFAELAGRERIGSGACRVFWTPRRLVLGAEVRERQADREEPVWGPSLKVARDAEGRWTAAAQGFAKKSGIPVDSLGEGVKDPGKPGERYLVLLRKERGREAMDVVSGLVAPLLRGLTFPKRMSWDAWLDDGRGAFPFGRPIRWLVALLDGQVVPFQIHALDGGVRGEKRLESGALTRGHRFLPPGRGGEEARVGGLADLRQALRERFCLLDPAERLARIDEGLAGAASPKAPLDDHGLRREWCDLVEYPTVLVGTVPAEFRMLPVEVLETVLVHHQKYVPLRESSGQVSRFAAVVNGDGSSGVGIVRGMERVVVARLRDAAFFLSEDRKRPLGERVADLEGVTFHQGLGTYRDKADRMVRLVEAMTREGLLGAEAGGQAREAARMAKADLTTLMVREFPELQGTVGGLYLAAEGAPESVASAVRWHYHPIAVEPDAAPAAAFEKRAHDSRVFAAVSLADKLDTLAGHFGMGESPTGSRDPFGLRRAGQGAVRAVLDFWRPAPGDPSPNLSGLLRAAIEGYGNALERPPAEAEASAATFLLDRLAYVLGARGFATDEVAAVLQAEADEGAGPQRALVDPLEALGRLEALQRVRRELPQDFAQLAEAFKRAKNILTQQEAAPSVDPALFEAEAERELHRTASRLAAAGGSHDDALRGLATLRAPVGRFFDEVLVMAEDPLVRGNRLALLRLTLSLFYRIADISKLGGSS